MNRTELDVGGYRHKIIWDNLAEQFNKNKGFPVDGGDAEENAYLDAIQLPHHLYDNESPEDFDQLEGQDPAQFIRWITNQYYVVHKSVSGDHAQFEDRIGEKGYLLYSHNMIETTGAKNIKMLMKAQPSTTVFAESMISGSAAGTTTTASDGTPHSSARKKQKLSRGPPPSTKEQTDKAFLRFLEKADTEDQQQTRATALQSSRDDYIREKKRIAVCGDEVVRTRQIAEAVEYNLQKWKKCLNELKDMENDGFSVYHPIYVATLKTAALYETSLMLHWQQPPRRHR